MVFHFRLFACCSGRPNRSAFSRSGLCSVPLSVRYEDVFVFNRGNFLVAVGSFSVL